jgi:dipeptidyl aminopeptidase/acylaminoacyl peptidase
VAESRTAAPVRVVAAGHSFGGSLTLLLAVLLLHAANDYSIAPGEALAAEMRRLKKPHDLKIYPAVGRNAREGHNFLYQSVERWESDVFAFLDQHLHP